MFSPSSVLPSAFSGLKLLAVLGTAQYGTGNLTVLAVGAVASILLFISLGRAVLPARKLVASVLLASLLILAFHTCLHQAALGWISTLRLLSASLLGIALTVTTRSGDLLDVLERLLSPLQGLGFKTERLALQLAMMLRFT